VLKNINTTLWMALARVDWRILQSAAALRSVGGGGGHLLAPMRQDDVTKRSR